MVTATQLYSGSVFTDDRGHLSFVNDFDFKDVKRFYQVQNHKAGFIRAWHGHQREGKYIYVVKGSAIVGCVKMTTSLTDISPQKFTLSDKTPKVLWIPPGYYNGFMSLSDDTTIQFFSTSTIEESKGDDIRMPWNQWNIWDVEYR